MGKIVFGYDRLCHVLVSTFLVLPNFHHSDVRGAQISGLRTSYAALPISRPNSVKISRGKVAGETDQGVGGHNKARPHSFRVQRCPLSWALGFVKDIMTLNVWDLGT